MPEEFNWNDPSALASEEPISPAASSAGIGEFDWTNPGNAAPVRAPNFALSEGVNPDQAAKERDLSQRSGLPQEAVAVDPAAAEEKIRNAESQKLLLDAPATTDWLAKDQNNLNITKDHVGLLVELENQWRMMAEDVKAVGRFFTEPLSEDLSDTEEHTQAQQEHEAETIEAFGGPIQELAVAAPLALASVVSGVGHGLGIYGRTQARLGAENDQRAFEADKRDAEQHSKALDAVGLSELKPLFVQPAAMPAPREASTALAVGKHMVFAGEAGKGIVDLLRKPQDEKGLKEDIAAAVGQASTNIIATILTGGAAALPLMFAQGIDMTVQDAEQEGMAGTPEADLAAVTSGTVTAATEYAQVGKFLKFIPGLASWTGRVIYGAGSEAVQEITEGAVNGLVKVWTYAPEGSAMEGLAYEGLVALGAGGIISALIPGKASLMDAERAKSQLERMDAATKVLVQGGIFKRAPELAVEHMAAVLAKHDLSVAIPAEAFDALEDPGIYERLGVSPEEVALSRDTGSGLRLSDEAFAREILASVEVYTVVKDALIIGENSVSVAQSKEVKPIRTFSIEELNLKQDPSAIADDALSAAEEIAGLKDMSEKVKDFGVSSQAWKDYGAALYARALEIKNKIAIGVLSRQQKKNTDEWKVELEATIEQQKESLRQTPVYAALDAVGRDRLNRAAVLALLDGDEAALKTLPKNNNRNIYTQGEEVGIDPRVLAEQWGFDSPGEMLRAFVHYPSLKDAARMAADVEMLKRHGDDAAHKNWALAEAQRELRSDRSADLLVHELNLLSNLPAAAKLSVKAFKEAAKARLAKKVIGTINQVEFTRLEERFAKEAGKAVKEGRIQEAGGLRYKHLLNLFFAKSSGTALARVAKQRKQLAKLANLTKGDASIEINHLREIQRTLLDYNFSGDKTRPGKHYQSMTLAEFDSLYGDVADLKRRGQELRTAAKIQEEFDSLLNDAALVQQAEASLAQDTLRTRALEKRQNLRGWMKFVDGLANLSVYLKKVESMIIDLDGDLFGPWRSLIFQPIADAQAFGNALTRDRMEPLVQALRELPQAARNRLEASYTIASMGGRKLTGHEILVMLLNSGNTSNYQKMIRGSETDEMATKDADGKPVVWTEASVEEALAKLGPEEVRWAQQVWDALNSLRPALEIVYSRENGGKPLKRVEPRPFTLAGVELQGGYFPMVYDRGRFSRKSELPEGIVMSDVYVTAAVERGMTIDRIENYAAPVLLNMAVLPASLAEVVHYVSHREAISRVEQTLNRPAVASVVIRKLGKEQHDGMRNWLGAIASDNKSPKDAGALDWVFSRLRTNLTWSILGYSFNAMMAQTLGLTSSVATLGRDAGGSFSRKEGIRWTAIGMDTYLSDPVAQAKTALALSSVLQQRFRDVDRDLAQNLASIAGKQDAWSQTLRAGMKGISSMQLYAVDIPTWIGAYHKANSLGRHGKDAVYYADAVIRTSQGGGSTMDLTALQRQKGVMRLLTMFSTYTMVAYNQAMQMSNDVKRTKDIPSALSRSMWVLVLPALIQSLLRGNPPDDEEEVAVWASLTVADYALSATPVVGFLLAGAAKAGSQPNMLKVENLGKDFVRSVEDLMGLMQSDPSVSLTDLAISAAPIAGVATGAPSAQIVRSLRAIDRDQPERILIGPERKK